MKGRNDLIKCSFEETGTNELKKGLWVPWLGYCDDYGYHVIEYKDKDFGKIVRTFSVFPYMWDLEKSGKAASEVSK